MTARLKLALLCGLSLAGAGTGEADELSGADKLRVLYSPQFSWTRQGLPLVTVRLSEGLTEVVLRGPIRVLPDGEMGSEVRGGQQWTVRLGGPIQQPVQRYHVIVGRAPAADADRLDALSRPWRERGFSPRIFELGTVFGIRGEVIDTRQLLLTVAPHEDEAAAKQEAATLAERHGAETAIYTEMVSRPRGELVAQDERGTVVRNEGVLWFAPDPAKDTAKDTAKADGVIRVEQTGRTYAGQIYVTPDRKGGLAVVNAVPEDRLLAGLVPAEMNPVAPLESLKAQAVAARNQLLAKLGTRHLGEPYRLCALTHCQVYAGAGRETPRTTAAVQATRGEFLATGGSGAQVLVDTVYSSSCGGHTEDNDQAWGTRPDPILRGHLDVPPAGPGEEAGRYSGRIGEAEVRQFLTDPGQPTPLCGKLRAGQASYRWSVRVPAETILKQLGVGLGRLKEVVVLSRGASGRVVAMRVVGTAGSKEVRTELEVRRVLGGLRSSLIALTPLREGGVLRELEILGGGHGHGVGMCQYGAMALGDAGVSYQKILEHYYPGARLRRLY